jgi:hypothetical protein
MDVTLSAIKPLVETMARRSVTDPPLERGEALIGRLIKRDGENDVVTRRR